MYSSCIPTWLSLIFVIFSACPFKFPPVTSYTLEQAQALGTGIVSAPQFIAYYPSVESSATWLLRPSGSEQNIWSQETFV